MIGGHSFTVGGSIGAEKDEEEWGARIAAAGNIADDPFELCEDLGLAEGEFCIFVRIVEGDDHVLYLG